MVKGQEVHMRRILFGLTLVLLSLSGLKSPSVSAEDLLCTTTNLAQCPSVVLQYLHGGKAQSADDDTNHPFPVQTDSHSYANIISNATTTVKSGAGNLHAVCLNKVGASANTATIYDNTVGSGTKIGTVDTTQAGVGCLVYDVKFSTGLTIVTATGTAGDITVSYR